MEKEEQVGRIWCRLTFLSPLDQEVGSVPQRLVGEHSIVCEHLREVSHTHPKSISGPSGGGGQESSFAEH